MPKSATAQDILLQTAADLCAKERSAQHEGVQRRALSTSDGEQGEHSDCSADVGREEVLDMVSELHARQRGLADEDNGMHENGNDEEP